MMWSFRVLLATSIMAARVVDLPLPVGPVTRIKPLGNDASLPMTGGSPNCSMVMISLGISLKTAATPYFCIKKLARYRASPGIS